MHSRGGKKGANVCNSGKLLQKLTLYMLYRLIQLIDVTPEVILLSFILTISLFFSQRQRKSV